MEFMYIALLDEKYIIYKSDIKKSDIKKTLSSKNLKKEDLYIGTEKLFLVIPATKTAIEKVKSLHLKEFDDYIIDKYYNRKIVVMYGNCHMGSLSEILDKCKPFTDEYVIYPIPLVCDVKSVDFFQHPVFRYCDLFIHQSIQINNRYGKAYASENIIQMLKDSCKVVSVPNVYHLPMCFFPQYTEDIELKKESTVFFRDSIIDEYCKKHGGISDIVRAYKDANYYSQEFIEEKWNKFIDTIRKREVEWDVKISDFLINNANKKIMFYDPNHPTEIIIKFIAKGLLDLLGIKLEDATNIDNIMITKLDSFEMPICQSVIDYFGMDYNLENRILRNSGVKRTKATMRLKQYIKQYISMIWQDKSFSNKIRIKSYFKGLKYELYYIAYIIKKTVKKIIKDLNTMYSNLVKRLQEFNEGD